MRGGAVIGVSVRFDYKEGFDRVRLIDVAEHSKSMFEGMPGLRSKVFTVDEENRRAMNFYLWETKEAAEAFFTDELRERVTGLNGVAPTIDFLEIAAIVDNSRA